MASNSTRPKCAFYILLLTSLWMFGGHIGKLNAQCTGPTLNLPDASSQPVLNPPNPYCTTINIDPAVTGHPIGLQMMLEHDWQGDLSIRINACGGTLMLLTRPGGGSCAGGCACGSSADIGTVGNPALVSFSDGGGPNPDLGIPITGGNFGLSTDPCGANSMISSFASLASLCGGAPYTIQVCITDHVGANDGIATNIRPMFPGIVCGCNDPAALNYNPAATVNDGTCTYPPPPLTCGSVFYDSGGASGSYSNGENTTTTICPTTPGDIVTVTFTAFNTESSYDKLYVYNGPNASSPQISSGNGSGSGICTTSGGFWGTSIPGPFTSTHPGGCLTFVFCSDGSLTYSGWAANVTCSTPCTPPAAPTASGQTIPPNTSCTLTASGCAGTLRWYNAPSGGTQVGTGSPFVTPVLSATTTYYVECSSGSCASARTPVTVTVQNPPAMPSCGANTWNVSVFSDNTYTTFMGFYNTPGHSISPGDGGNDPLDIEFNVGKDGVPVNGFPSQANGYTGLPLTDEAFSIRAERCGFPCGAYYYINVRAFDDHVRVRVDQTGDGTYEFDYSNGPPRSTTPTDIWNGFLGPNSRVIIEGYNIGPGHPLYVSPNEFFLHVAFYNDQNHPLLTANAGADANFCSPGSVGIGGTPAATQGVPGYTYSWLPAGTLSNSGIANPTASPASPTTYTLTVTDARGCTATDNVTVTPMLCCTANAGAVAINPNPPCPGGIFTASATGHQTAAGYTQTFILVSNTGSVLAISPSGNFTMPAACGTYAVYSYNYLTAGTAITNPATIGQIVCQPTHCCDLSAPLTFTTSATVTMPADAGSTVACVSAATAPTPPDVMYSCGGLLARSGPVAGADPACAGVKTYVWTYTDACNSQTYNWTYTYTISAPTVSMPAPGASTVGCASAAVQPTPPNVTDNCGRALTPSGPVVSPDPACAGTKTYTWTYTDCAGNPYTWVYTYTISAPTVSMPAPGGSSVSCTSAAVPPTPPNVTDNCGRALTPSGPVISPDPACAGTKTYTWTYTDCAGNPYTWVYTYTITAPTVTMPAPGSSAVSCVSAAVQPTPPNVTDNCGNTLTPSGPVVSPDPACAGAKTYTWTYTDCAGSTYNWVYTYTITAPTVSMPAAGASTVDCVAAAVPPTPPNVADNCGRPLTPSSPVISPDPACAGAKTYIWTYTDCAGNPYTWVYTYTISAPTVSMPAPGGSSVSCASAAVQPTPPNVTDNCGRALTPSGPVVSPNPICAGTKTYTWAYTDCTGSAYTWVYTYTITGGTGGPMPPNGASTVACPSGASAPTPPVVNDNCGNPMQISGPMVGPDPACAGTKTYTWTYTDCQNNTYPWTYTYTILGPTVSMPAPGAGTVSCASAAVQPTPPNVADNCGRALARSGPVVSPDPACAGTKTYTWTYTDCQNNTYPWVYTYTILGPTVSMPAPGAGTVSCASAAVQPTPPNIADNCGRALARSGPVVSPDPACAGTKTYTWTYTDCAGSTHNWVYTYNITAPTVNMPAPGSSSVSCASAAVQPTPPNVTDNCGRALTPSGPVISPDPACAGTKTYMWTYTDCAGSTYNWVYTYTISAPTVNMPAPGSSTVSCASAAVQPTPPNVTDNCGRALTPSGPVVSPNPICAGTKTYTWAYTDCTGSAYTWVYTYTITGGTGGPMPPNGASTVACPSGASAPTPPVVNDNCGNPMQISGPVVSPDPACAGTKTYTWTYTDCQNNTYLWSYHYMVSAPTFTMPSDQSQNVACVADAQVVPSHPNVVNSCGVPLAVSGPVAGSNPACSGAKTYTWTYTNCDGASANWTFSYFIAAPQLSLSCPADQTFCRSANGQYVLPQASANSSCGGAVPISYSITGATTRSGSGNDASGTFNVGQSVITWQTNTSCGQPQQCVTVVTVQQEPALSLVSISCAADLNSYQVVFSSTGGIISVSPMVGAVSGNSITGIPAGTNITITATENGCPSAPLAIAAPDCSCPPIAAPTLNPATLTICAGDPIPTFTASVGAGLSVNWYAVAAGGAPLSANSLSFTPAGAGTYFAETFDAQTNCRSATRTPATLVVNATQVPAFTQAPPICTGGAFTLPATSNNGISGTWSPAVNNTTTTIYTFTPNAAIHPCAVTTTMMVQVNPVQTPSFTQIQPICAGTSFGLPAISENGIAGTWSPGINNLATTTYTFTPDASAHPCALPTTMTVQVNPLQTPVFTQVPPICAGGSFSLPATSNNGIAGSWFPAVNNMATTTYTFTPAAAAHPCAIPTTMTVQVNPTQIPVFTQIQPICAGGSFSLQTLSNNGISGTWLPVVNNTLTTTYTFTPNAAAHPCAVTATMTVQVDAQPTLTIGAVACAPDLLTYSVQFTATGGTVSATAGTLSGNMVTGIPAGTNVTILVSNGTNTACDVSQNVTAPDCNCPAIAAPTIAVPSATICAGAAIPSFTASVPVGLTVIWYDAATGGTVLLNNNLSFTTSAAGTYFAEAFDPQTNCRSATRTQVTLTINPTQTPSFTQINPICAGGSFSLPAMSDNGIAGTWSPAVNNTTTTTYTFTPNAAAHPCAVTATMTVQVDAQPTLTIGTVACAPDLLTYSVSFTATGGTVSATAGALSGNMVTGIPAGTNLTISVSNGTNTACDVSQNVTAPDCNCPPIAAPSIAIPSATICAGAAIPSFTPSVPAGLTVIWYDAATGGTVLLNNNLLFTPTAAGTYFAEAFDPQTNCRSATRTQVTLTINPTQTPSFTQVSPICSGGSFSLPATSNNGIAGSWSPAINNTQTITYTFTPNAALHPCAVTTTMTVQVDAQPTLSIGAVACAPDLLTYSVSFTATGGTVSATAGALSGNMVTGIPAGTNVTISVSNGTNTACDVSQNVTAPDCNCPPIAAPSIAVPTATICAGAAIPSFTASVPAGLTVIWYDAATGGTVLLNNNLLFTPTAAGTYFAEAFDPQTNCRSATRTQVTLTINPTQTPSFTQVSPICAGGSFSLPATSNNGIAGSWSPAINNTQTITYTFTPNAALHPCAVTTTMTVQVDAQPTLSIGTVACAPDLLTYSVSFTATGGTVSATAGALSGNMVTGIPAGTNLTISVSNGTNTACDVSQNVTAPDCNCPPIAAPSIAIPSATICAGAAIPSFTASVPAELTVIWYDAATGGTVLLNNNLSFTPSAAGTYFAEAFDPQTNCRSATRTQVTLTINPTQTPSFTQIPPICAGASFSLPATSNNGIAGSWSPAINNTATTTYTFTPNATLHPCAVTATMTVQVDTQPTLTIGAVACAADLLTYSVSFTATGGTVSATAGALSGNMVTGIPAGTNLTISVSNGTNTACDVSQNMTAPNCNCPLIAAPSIAVPTATICAGAAIPSFTASVPAGLTVIWYDAATGGMVLLNNNLSFTPSAAGTYFAEAFDPQTNCRSATRTQVTLTINSTQTPSFTQVPPICAGASFSLPATSNNGIAGSWSPAINNTATTTYTFTPNAAAHPCAVTTTMTVQVTPLPTATANPAEICAGQSATLSASGGSFYQWSTGASGPSVSVTPSSTTTYSVTVTTEGCSSVATATVTVHPLPVPAIARSADVICTGGTATLTASGGNTYQWSTGEQTPVIVVSPTVTAMYSVTATDQRGCTASASTSVQVNALPLVQLSADNLGCYGERRGRLEIEQISGGLPPYSYAIGSEAWRSVGALPATAAADLAPGNYQFRVRDSGNCLNTTSFVIPEAPQLRLDLGPDPIIRIGDSLLLEGLANFVIDSVVWSPDTLLSAPDAAATFARPLTTTGFSLTAFDRNGCRVSDQVIVYVQRVVDVFVPNAFSPNGDGVNDKLVVLTERKIQHIRSFSIFSRWGEEVFFVSDFPPNDPTYGWDGTHRGSALNAGVFVYYLEVVYPDGGVELLKGDVLLMR